MSLLAKLNISEAVTFVGTPFDPICYVQGNLRGKRITKLIRTHDS